ncbi:MAG: hypothetical protein IKP92_05985 [Lachnospiraceae bacterium]|nr:hypothetical protein [Lachnospiraceae bacterium]
MNTRIIFLFVVSLIIFFASGCKGNLSSGNDEKQEISPEVFYVIDNYDSIPDKVQEWFSANNNGKYFFLNEFTELYWYCDTLEAYQYPTAKSYVHFWVNGRKERLPNFGKAYYSNEGNPPKIIFADLNKDLLKDFIIWDETERGGIVEYTFLSDKKEEGTFVYSGSISWDIDKDMFTNEEKFLYDISLVDKKRYHIVSEDWLIDEEVDIPEEIYQYVFSQGAYDGDSLTNRGKDWFLDGKDLIEREIEVKVIEEEVVICCRYEIYSNYSTCGIGYGFEITWKVNSVGQHTIDSVRLIEF